MKPTTTDIYPILKRICLSIERLEKESAQHNGELIKLRTQVESTHRSIKKMIQDPENRAFVEAIKKDFRYNRGR